MSKGQPKDDDGLKPDRESVTETVSKVDASRTREKAAADERSRENKGDQQRRR